MTNRVKSSLLVFPDSKGEKGESLNQPAMQQAYEMGRWFQEADI